MPHQATITAVVGPGKSITSGVFKNITEIHLYPDRKIISLGQGQLNSEIDINGVTTFTVSITSGSYALTLS